MKKIELSVEYLEKRSDFGFVHTLANLVDEQDKKLKTSFSFRGYKEGYIAKSLMLGNFICNSTVVVRKKCFEKSGYFDESIFVPADWDMWIRLAEHYKVGYINRSLTSYRIFENYTLKNLQQSRKESVVVMEKVLQRNPGLSIGFKKRLVSNRYFYHSQCCLGATNLEEAIYYAKLSIKESPFNYKSFLLLLHLVLLKSRVGPLYKRFKGAFRKA